MIYRFVLLSAIMVTFVLQRHLSLYSKMLATRKDDEENDEGA